MAMDALSQALAQRRGRSLDARLYADHPGNFENGQGLAAGGEGHEAHIGEKDASHAGIDHRVGVDGAKSSKGEEHGTPWTDGNNLPHPVAPQHTPVGHEGDGMSPHPNWRSPAHLDEHMKVAREESRGEPQPRSQSAGVGEGELHDEIREHIIGHTSEGEHDQLMAQGHRPRSLGERAKMMALKEKEEKK